MQKLKTVLKFEVDRLLAVDCKFNEPEMKERD